MTITISFFVALIGIVGMIGLKALELKREQKFFLSKLALKTDHFMERIYKAIKTFISHLNKPNAIALVQWLAFHVLSWIRKLYLLVREKAHAHPHSKKVIDMVRGKGEVQKNGGASFYLKRISEEH